MRLIGQPIKHRFAQPRVREHSGPLRKRQIRCDDHRRSLRSPRDDLEQHLRRGFRHRHIGHLVDHDQLVARPPVGHSIKFAPVLGFGQFVHQLRRRREPYLESKFGESLSLARAAMRDLAKAFRPEQLRTNAFRLYEEFRPAIPEGVKGWGAKGNLDIDRIRSLALKK